MARLGIETEIVDRKLFASTVAWFREAKITLPTFAELAAPWTIPAAIREGLAAVGPDEAHPLNLFRVHWYNGPGRRAQVEVPDHVVLPEAVTGTKAQIVVALGRNFPMIEAHKVLAAYACLAPRVVTGQFDPTTHRALWPSTGNYCRGGVAISRIMRCRGVAILPAEMSRERFEWLERWVADPSDIVKTPGSESNVKEIYDKCAELDRDPHNVIFNQFCEFGNHLAHYAITGRALGHVFESMSARDPELRLRAFTSATGSAGTTPAGTRSTSTGCRSGRPSTPCATCSICTSAARSPAWCSTAPPRTMPPSRCSTGATEVDLFGAKKRAKTPMEVA